MPNRSARRHTQRTTHPAAVGRRPRYHTRRVQRPEPKAESREPKAESREPRAESREPRAESLHGFARTDNHDRMRHQLAGRACSAPTFTGAGSPSLRLYSTSMAHCDPAFAHVPRREAVSFGLASRRRLTGASHGLLALRLTDRRRFCFRRPRRSYLRLAWRWSTAATPRRPRCDAGVCGAARTGRNERAGNMDSGAAADGRARAARGLAADPH